MIFRKQNTNKIYEENIFIQSFGTKISKNLKVFYNPEMKLNRDISLLVLKTYFENKKIKFCDPMAASGIRELRFLKTIPEIFSELIIGDISKTAIKNIKKNFSKNKISKKKLKLLNQDANQTISSAYFDFIEIDPFGSPVPFLDAAVQKIKHNGILSVTATDTAALCGTYPKTTLRKYRITTQMTLWHEELGLRNLIAYCQRQGAKYNKTLTPLISYTNKHYYKIFFKVEESRTKALQTIKNLKHIEYNRKTQATTIAEHETLTSLGKTYIEKLQNKDFLKLLKTNLSLIQNNKEVTQLLESIENEIEIIGYYNPHKFQKEYKFNTQIKFNEIIETLEKQNYEVSRPHNNRLGIKTNCPTKEFIKIMQR